MPGPQASSPAAAEKNQLSCNNVPNTVSVGADQVCAGRGQAGTPSLPAPYFQRFNVVARGLPKALMIQELK